MSDVLPDDPGFDVVERSLAGPLETCGPVWVGGLGFLGIVHVFNKEAGHFMEEIVQEASSLQDFSCDRTKVLAIIEDCGLHDQREDLFQWVDQFEVKSKEVLGGKGTESEPGN